jgi:hypothetical protein
MIGPTTAQVVVPDMKLPPMTPTPHVRVLEALAGGRADQPARWNIGPVMTGPVEHWAGSAGGGRRDGWDGWDGR